MATPHRVGKYDVFISHCGRDCKKGFADLLRDDLERVGVQCFFDEHCLEVGEVAAARMLKAMEEATYGVVILSPGFWEREWCMKELKTFMRRGMIVPVFYGGFQAVRAAAEAALAKGVWRDFKHFEWDEETFRQLVNESTNFTGVRLEEEDWWLSCIRRVRDEVLRLLGKVGGGIRISEDELLVGQEEHLKELKRLLGLPQEGSVGASGNQAAGEVGIVGVKGMGGVGKTTMAKKLYDEVDVREWFNGGVCWLEMGQNADGDKIAKLQRQILRELGDSKDEPWNPTRGRELIRRKLNGKRVLICLDDVWETVSVATAVVNVGDLAPGSRILKTSRKRESIGGHVHDLDSLEQGPAWELFCWHAFGGEKPPEGLAELAKEAAVRCGGLPLALRVLGRQVAEAEDKEGCITGFLNLPRYDDSMRACRSVIKTSYDNLPTDFPGLGDVFILIAGVWPRTQESMQRERAVENLGAAVYGDEPRIKRFKVANEALEKLHNLSLVGMEEEKNLKILCLKVHDLIIDVAESLVDQREQGCGRFFRQPADADELGLPRGSGREGGLEHLSIHLGPLSIQQVPAACSLVLGSGASLVRTVSDDDNASPCRLLVLEKVQAVPVRRLHNVQCLRLGRGTSDPFPEGFGNMRHLCILEIRSCSALRGLPESLGQLTALTSLDLRWCDELQSLPDSVGQLTGLTNLALGGCKVLRRLPESVWALTGLTSLDLTTCFEMASSLPNSVGQLTRLTKLSLYMWRLLKSVPESVGRLTKLTDLDLRECSMLKRLPESIGLLTGLTSLDLSGCRSMETLPESVGALTRLTSLDLSGWVGERLPESVGKLTGLTSLELSGFFTPSPREELEALRGRLPPSRPLEDLWSTLESSGCLAGGPSRLQSLPGSVAALTGLTSLGLKLCGALRSLPEWVGTLTGLTRLDLSECRALRGLPESVGALTGLTTLNLRGCGALRSLPESIGALTRLTSLDLSKCGALQSLPVTVWALTRLTRLDLGECKALQGASLYWRDAAKGNVYAQCALGDCYFNGNGVKKDKARAAKLYAKAAEQGDAKARMCLGNCYFFGEGVEKDEARAAVLYAEAAKKGYAAAQFNLGNCYKGGRGVQRNEAQAAALYAEAAQQGHTAAQFNLGNCYQGGKGVEKDEARAAALYAKAAEQGHASAQFNLGKCYEGGRGVGKDQGRAAELFAKAAKRGHAAAQFHLGSCYKGGRGVEKDEQRAAELYAEAAKQGDVRAQCALAACYEATAAELYAKAAELYANAAEKGSARGQCCLGECYARGRGVEKDGAKAVEWMRMAAQQGDPGMKANLAEYLMEGLGGEPDWLEALHLFESSLGTSAPSKVTSAWMLWSGQYGVRQDRLKAKTMCKEVITMEDLEDQLHGWEALGWTWPAALEWFRSEVWHAEVLSGEAVEGGDGESGSPRKSEGNGVTPAHLGEGALHGTSGQGNSARESHTFIAAVRANDAHPGDEQNANIDRQDFVTKNQSSSDKCCCIL